MNSLPSFPEDSGSCHHCWSQAVLKFIVLETCKQRGKNTRKSYIKNSAWVCKMWRKPFTFHLLLISQFSNMNFIIVALLQADQKLSQWIKPTKNSYYGKVNLFLHSRLLNIYLLSFFINPESWDHLFILFHISPRSQVLRGALYVVLGCFGFGFCLSGFFMLFN